jgi:hypothetical protein
LGRKELLASLNKTAQHVPLNCEGTITRKEVINESGYVEPVGQCNQAFQNRWIWKLWLVAR